MTSYGVRKEKARPFTLFAPSVPKEDIVFFSKLFAGTLKAGVSIKDSLKILTKQIENKVLQERIGTVLVDLESGVSLSSAFGKHTDIFPEFYPMLLKAGEVSGDIGTVLEYIGDYMDRMISIRKELIGVFIYPAIVLTMTVGLLSVILVFVAPNFIQVFSKTKLVLPLLTRILFAASDAVTHHTTEIGVGLLVLFCAGFFVRKLPQFKAYYDRIIVRFPYFGPVIRQSMMLQFLRSFDILVNNNVPLLQSLKVIEDSTSHTQLKAVAKKMREDVHKGLSFSAPLLMYPWLISPVIAHTIAMGEKSGNLGESIKLISQFVDRELTLSIKQLASRLNPILTLVLGVIVLTIALSVYLPIFDMMIQMGTQ